MPEARGPQATQGDEDPEDPDLDRDRDPSTLDASTLAQQGNVAGLLELAKAYRAGTAAGGRDLMKCFEAYRAAADLGSGEAEYAVALFHMSGGVVPQDLKEGTTRLRGAAEKGSVPAKVYLGNLYELGIHYKVDPEKADVWYRNAARGARIEAEPGSDAWVRELAELGCVRQVLALTGGATNLDEGERARLLQRARAHGHGLKLKDAASEPTGDRPTFLDALQNADAPANAGPTGATGSAKTPATAGTPAPRPGKAAAEPNPATATAKRPEDAGPSQASFALAAFGYTLLFAVAAVGAAYAATLGARELVTHGKILPAIGTRTELVFPIVFGLVGVLPSWLVYRFGTVLKGVIIGGALGGVGWIAWGTGQAVLHGDRLVQTQAFAIAGFLAGLLALGFLGGTKKRPPVRRKGVRPPFG